MSKPHQEDVIQEEVEDYTSKKNLNSNETVKQNIEQ